MEVLSFGPYRLSPDSRLLQKDGVTLQLGSRSLDILIVLAGRAGDLVCAKELVSRVWRGGIVAPGALRVHIAALRKALGDGRNGARYVANVRGLGYCFVAPITLASHPAQNDSIAAASSGAEWAPRGEVTLSPLRPHQPANAVSRVQELERRVKELQRLLGEKTLEYEILKKGFRGRSRTLQRAVLMRGVACNDEQPLSELQSRARASANLR